ncbi:MAG: hypothetical protein JXA92_08580 [candidate division Zixibacteria bacterium]|nr:hypothetical protein [candidate division Zixibacteria bacterium]
MEYFILIIVVLIGSVLLLNLRVRLELDDTRRLIFVGLGRSGFEFDFAGKISYLKIYGFRIKSFKQVKKAKEAVVEKEVVKKKPSRKVPRQRSPRDIIKILPQCSRALFKYFIDIVKSLAIEELKGEIEGGFDSPDLTGRAFGYYRAVLGVVPALEGHFRYYPVWNGAAFSGSLRMAVVLPLYKMLYRTLVLAFRLPLRKIIKVAIGTKKGEQDVK